MKQADIIVVGAGLVGLTTAMALRRAGLRPLVIEAGEDDAMGAAVHAPWRLPHWLQDMVSQHAERLPELVTQLGQLTGVDCELRRAGLVLVGDQADGGQIWIEQHRDDCHWGQVANFEPGLSGGERDALLLAGVRRVRASRLAHALRLALPRWQVPVISGRPVLRLDVAGNIVLGVELADGRYLGAEAVVLAAGSQINPILFDSGLERLAIDPPMVAQLLFNPGERLIQHAVNTGDCALVPLHDGRILAIDLQGAIDDPDAAVEDLFERVGNWLPALSRFDLQASGMGPGPALSEQGPAVGAYPQLRGLWVNAGHARRGLDISLAAAASLAGQLDGGPVDKTLAARLATAA